MAHEDNRPYADMLELLNMRVVSVVHVDILLRPLPTCFKDADMHVVNLYVY